MRTIIAAIVLSIITSSSMATTLKEFNAMPKAKQSTVVADFVDKITTDLRAKNGNSPCHPALPTNGQVSTSLNCEQKSV
jgi:hypothetical protein